MVTGGLVWGSRCDHPGAVEGRLFCGGGRAPVVQDPELPTQGWALVWLSRGGTLQITFQHQKGWERQQSPHGVHVGKHKLSQGHNNNQRCAQKH